MSNEVLANYKQCMCLIKHVIYTDVAQRFGDDLSEESLLYKALKRIDELVQKDEKYAWHDLRKNPDDLPDVDSFVLCEWVGGSHNWHDVFLFDNDPRPHFRNTHGNMISIIGDEKFTYEGQVIAWKYIESFE